MYLMIYDSEGEKIDILQNYTSIQWTRKYANTGQFEIHAAATDSNIANLKTGNRLVNQSTKEIGFISSVYLSDNEMEIRGYLNNLDQRINISTHHFGVNVEKDVNQMITDNLRGLDIKFEDKELLTYDGLDMESTWETLQDTVDKVCEQTGFGYRMRASVGTSIQLNCFSMYKGAVKNVKFSDKLSNLTFQEIELDYSDFKNYAYVCAEGQDEKRTVVEVDLTNGQNRCELYVDSRNTSRTYRDEDGVEHTYTDEEYTNLLIDEGMEALSEHMSVDSFSCGIDTTDSLFRFRIDYDLGDIIHVENVRYGIYDALYRISEVCEIDENGTESVDLTLSKYETEISKLRGGIA